MSPAAPTVVLWDIDGTLLRSRGLGARAFADAVTAVLGRPGHEVTFDFSGRTDPDIALGHLRANGIDDSALVPDVLDALGVAYAERHDELAEVAHLMPGVADLVTALDRAGALQTAVTGNIAPVARQKLDVVGLVPPLRPELGGYGSDHHDRPHLVEVALERVAAGGVPVDRSRCWVVGDTPRDAACAAAAGVRCLLVATGRYSTVELEDLGADAVLGDLAGTEAVLALLAGSG